MSSRSKRRAWILAGGLVLAVVCAGWLGGARTSPSVPVKAMFVSGYLPDSPLPNIPNKITNDNGSWYQNGNSNIIVLNGGAGSLTFSVDARSGRSVVLLFGSVVAPPGTGGDVCGEPYFLAGPVSTINWQFGTKNECVLMGPPDPEGFYEMIIKDNYLNLLTMTENQVAYAYLQPMRFYVADSKSTSRNDSRDMYIMEWEPNYVMVKASGWDGTKVTTWTITPVTSKFKHMKGETANDPVPQYYLYDYGTIPRWLFSNARRGCFHGIYNLPFELIITRQ